MNNSHDIQLVVCILCIICSLHVRVSQINTVYLRHINIYTESFVFLKAKKVKIKAGVTIGPERRRSRKCLAEEQC